MIRLSGFSEIDSIGNQSIECRCATGAFHGSLSSSCPVRQHAKLGDYSISWNDLDATDKSGRRTHPLCG